VERFFGLFLSPNCVDALFRAFFPIEEFLYYRVSYFHFNIVVIITPFDLGYISKYRVP